MRTPALLSTLLLAACGGSAEPTAPSAPSAPAPADHAAHGEAALGAYVPVTGEGKRVFFVEPADGATVTSPVKVVFGVEGLEVVPAGQLEANTGHHHIVIDGAPVPEGVAVPADERNIHYGKGQTETTLELPPGEHTLTMQFADGAHRSYGPGFAQTVRITVAEGEGTQAAGGTPE